MVGKILALLVLEGIVGTKNLRYKYVGLFNNTTAAVSWTKRGAAKKSTASGRLLRVLALRQQVTRVSPFVDAHEAGYLNVLGDIPSQSFGYPKQWHCTNDSEFLSLINPKFPLPRQRPWQGSRISFTLSTKVISELGTNSYPIGEWGELLRIG